MGSTRADRTGIEPANTVLINAHGGAVTTQAMKPIVLGCLLRL